MTIAVTMLRNDVGGGACFRGLVDDDFDVDLELDVLRFDDDGADEICDGVTHRCVLVLITVVMPTMDFSHFVAWILRH